MLLVELETDDGSGKRSPNLHDIDIIDVINSNLSAVFTFLLDANNHLISPMAPDEPEIPLCKKRYTAICSSHLSNPLPEIKLLAVPLYFQGASNTRSSWFCTCITKEAET